MFRFGPKGLLAAYVLLALVFATGDGVVQRSAFHVATAAAVVAIVAGMRRYRPAHRAPWILFATGCGLVTVAALAVDVLALPAPSFADALFASGYVSVVCGLLLLASRRLAGGMVVAV